MVIKSSAFIINYPDVKLPSLSSFSWSFIVTQNPIKAIIPKTPTNFIESLWKENLVGFGNKIDLTNCPLLVENPVWDAIANIGIFPFSGCLPSMHLVPANRVHYLLSS